MKRFLALLLCLSAVVYSQTRQVPNLGSSANDGTGDSLRTFGQKVANNESNLFKAVFTNGPAARVVETVADLVAFTGFDGVRVVTLGYHAPGDGGGGVYRWTNALPSGTTTNKTFWIDSADGVWGLQHFGRVDIRQTGFTGSGAEADTLLLQAALDEAPDGMEFVVPDGTFDVTRGILFRRHNLTMSGSGTLRGFDDLYYGTLIDITNATNITVKDITIDVNYQLDNGITVIGNTDEFGTDLTELVGENYAQNITLKNLRVFRARFHANMVEGIDVSVAPAFTPGNELWQYAGGKRSRALILTNDVANSRVTVRYLDNRFQIGPEVEEFASGVPTGEVRVVSGRTNIPQVAPNGATYNTLQGLFGGKGISIQYGTKSVTVSDCHIEDCDTGITVEGNSAAGRGNHGTVIVNCVIRDSGRTGVWFTNSGSTVEDQSIFGPMLRGIRIVNWGHTWSGFGAISSDRGMFINGDFSVNMETNYVTAGPVVVWQGQAAHSTVRITADLPQASGLLDFRRAAVWGNLPGFFIEGSRNNDFYIRAKVGTVTTGPAWTNSVATNVVQNYAVDWEPATTDALATSNIKLDTLGWTNGLWFGRANSTVRYEIADRSNNSNTAIGSSDNVEFASGYRLTFTGVGAEPERVAAAFRDRIEVNRKMSFGGNLGEIGYDFTNSWPYIKANSGTFRLLATDGTPLARLASGRLQTESSTFNGKNFGMGSYVYWQSGDTMYTKNGTPSSVSDGQPVVPSPSTIAINDSAGVLTLSGGQKRTYSWHWGADANVTLDFSGIVDGDTGTLQISHHPTNPYNVILPSYAFSSAGATNTIPASDGNGSFSVLTYENKVVTGTNRVAVNVATYSR